MVKPTRGGRSARVVLVSCQLAILEKWTNRIGPHWRFASLSPNGREEREIERRCSLPTSCDNCSNPSGIRNAISHAARSREIAAASGTSRTESKAALAQLPSLAPSHLALRFLSPAGKDIGRGCRGNQGRESVARPACEAVRDHSTSPGMVRDVSLRSIRRRTNPPRRT